MSGNELKKKGIIFALDALVAVIVLALFVASIPFLAAKSSESSYSHVFLERQADDALLALDKGGIFQTSLSQIGGNLNFTLGNEISYELLLDIYSNDGAGTFTHSSSGISSNISNVSLKNAKLIASSMRAIVLPQAGNSSQFGIATLRVWKE